MPFKWVTFNGFRRVSRILNRFVAWPHHHLVVAVAEEYLSDDLNVITSEGTTL